MSAPGYDRFTLTSRPIDAEEQVEQTEAEAKEEQGE